MLKYKEFYRSKGIRFVRDLLSPTVWYSDALTYPNKSILIWYNSKNTQEHPSKEFGIFSKLEKPYVITKTKYSEEASFGAPKPRPVSESKIIKAAKRKSPSFKYLKSAGSVTVPSSKILLFNLGSINTGYRYVSHPLSVYWVWKNSLVTAANTATYKGSGVGRHKFIFMNLPYNIPTLAMFKKHANNVTRNTLSVFDQPDSFNMLELFRFMDKDTVEQSVLANTIDPSEFGNIDLILNINNKSVVVNLGVLASITDAHSYESSLKSYNSKTAVKILYVFLKNILLRSAVYEKTAESAPGVSGFTEADIDNITLDADKVKEVDIDDAVLEVSSGDVDDGFEVSEDVSKSEVDNVITAIAANNAIDATPTAGVDIEMSPETNDNSVLVNQLNALVANNGMTRLKADKLISALEEQSVKGSPYNNGIKLSDMLTYTGEELVITDVSSAISDSPAVLDKSNNSDTLAALNVKYNKETRQKDILSVLYATQKAGLVITDHIIEPTKSVLGETEEHTLSVELLNGKKSTIRVVLPVIADDNTFKISGNTYLMRKQRSDVPIKKISNNQVSLSSYYGKLFITRASYKRNDVGFWLHKQLITLSETDKDLRDIASLNVSEPGITVPKDYGIINRYIKELTYKNVKFNFSYKDRTNLIKGLDLSKIEKNSVIVGVSKDTPVMMDFNNNLYMLDKDRTKLGTIYEYLGLSLDKIPVEYCTVKVYKKTLPLIYLLGYYLGLTNILKLLKVKYSVVETGKRVKLEPNQYKVVFKDITYVIDKDDGVGDLVLYGFKDIAKDIKLVPVSSFESKTGFAAVFAASSMPVLYINEIKLMENMFIDPITKQLLEIYKQPTTFSGVLLKAAELLEDDNYKHPNSMDGVVLKGNERISGMLYSEMVKGIRMANNKSYFSKSALNVNPYAVMSSINSDSTTVLVDDLNPIASIKQLEDVTYLGAHGRSEATMSESTRIMHVSEIGVLSEAVKDSGAVGISAYLTASPNITTTRGTIGEPDKDADWVNLLSTTAMLSPFAITDDPKRLIFSLLQ